MLNFISYEDENDQHDRYFRSVAKFLFTPIILWSTLSALFGLMGLIIYAIFVSYDGGPEYITNEYIGIWMSGVLLSVSGQLIYLISKPPDRDQKKKKWSDRILFAMNGLYFGLMLVMSLVIMIGYSMYGLRVDLIVCSVLIFSIGLLSFGVVILRWFARGMVPCDCCYEMEDDDDNVSASHPLMFSFKMSVNREKPKKRNNSCLLNCVKYTCLFGVNSVLRIVSIVILLLLAFGAVNLANIVNISKRGRMVKVKLNDGSERVQKIHLICDGPKESNQSSTFIFESDFSHNYADFSDIQTYMTQLGRRSCIFDKPGLGFSDYLFKDQKNVSTFYHNFMQSIGEQPPYIFVGWGGGGSIIYQYARDHPEMVKSLTFLDVFPDGIEFTSAKILKKLTESEYEAFKKSELNSRRSIMNIVNAIGVPLGIMPFIIGPNSNTSNSNEIAFWMRTEKTWITQSVFLDEMINNQNYTDSVFNLNLPQNIPINLVISKHNDSWVEQNNYQCKSFGIDSKECKYQVELNKFYVESQLNIVPSLNGGSVTFCTDNDCSQSYYTFINPKYTAETLNRIYQKDI